MGDQDQRRLMLPLEVKQQVHDHGPGGAVQVAGRFIGEQQGGVGDERPGQRDPLLLPTGQFAGEVP